MNNKIEESIQWQIDQFDDVKILQYRVSGFEELPCKQKELIYYLSEAALCGRDILFDQHCKPNLKIRKLLEAIYLNYSGDKNSVEWSEFEVYLKKVWFSSGIHHHYSNDKFTPQCSTDYFKLLLSDIANKNPFDTEITEALLDDIFNLAKYPKRISQDTSTDLIRASAVNLYEGVTEQEVVEYYKSITKPNDHTPISYGLNSKVIKQDGKIVEQVYKVGGLYTGAIEQIVFWLNKATSVAENKHQKQTIEALIEFYKSGDLHQFDEYSILWVQDTSSRVDFINGFIETYTDPLGVKATWESLVNFKDIEATKRTEIISSNAQWFEDNSPVENKYKKPVVKGVSAKVITAAIIGGDCYPASPIGINLPNADWIRRDYGSKSVTIANFTYAYQKVSQTSGYADEFYTTEIKERMNKYGALSKDISVDLHECLGHGSGQLAKGIVGDELKNYASPLEEARAELFAMYYIADNKLIELGILPCEASSQAEYDSFMHNGLIGQLIRIKQGDKIEQAHMRCRAMIAWLAFEKGQEESVMELYKQDDKTYLRINDYNKLRTIFGTMLKEIQRIKSEGDYEAGKKLIEKYGVNINQELHKEILARYGKLGIAPYSGFINPVYRPIKDDCNRIVDIAIDYPANYTEQQIYYSSNYSFL